MNLKKILLRILTLFFAAAIMVGIVTPLEKTSWAQAKRSEGVHERHGEADRQETTDADTASIEASGQPVERKRESRSQNEISMKRILKPLAKETLLMGIPFALTLGVMKVWRWKLNSSR